MAKVQRALVSVSDKTGLEPLAQALSKLGVEVLSTGGTAKALVGYGCKVTPIAQYTGAPEILDGRVKTLHPKIHGGLLGRPIPEHEAQMKEQGIGPIDLVVVNLYPFEATVARGAEFQEVIENIDIGGPSMLRSSAKNFERVAVVVDPADYGEIIAALENDGEIPRATRFRLAKKVFARTAAYDAAISAHLSKYAKEGGEASDFPEALTVQWKRHSELRYGENPHQKAAFYAAPGERPNLAGAEVLQGKALSYNNILDLDGALECCLEFSEPTAVVVKHTNPCGVATHKSSIAEAYRRARATDPVSSFGGIVATNREVDEELAKELTETFLECVVAPSYSAVAKEILAKKKNLRLVALGALPQKLPEPAGHAMRTVSGGLLVQSWDSKVVDQTSVCTKRTPSSDEDRALHFAWKVAKHVKSNAIVYARALEDGLQTVGIGAGQMSRVDSAEIAKQKADKAGLPIKGSVVASDAFFPFRDGLDVLAQAGATAVIQPGGSVRDKEVIAAADEQNVAMVLTGMRHFKH